MSVSCDVRTRGWDWDSSPHLRKAFAGHENNFSVDTETNTPTPRTRTPPTTPFTPRYGEGAGKWVRRAGPPRDLLGSVSGVAAVGARCPAVHGKSLGR